jgi:DNA-directed RNA polymerase subunit beta
MTLSECKQRGLTYSAPLKADTLRLVVYDVNEEEQTKQILICKRTRGLHG